MRSLTSILWIAPHPGKVIEAPETEAARLFVRAILSPVRALTARRSSEEEAMPVKPIPDGYHTVTPVLVVEGAGRLIEFMTSAFGARERMRMPMPDGTVAHAEVEIGDSPLMVADATAEFPAGHAMVHLYVEDTDAVYARAVEAGAATVRPPEDQFYGDRSATVRDPFGNQWSIATHVEDVSEEELQRRLAAAGMPTG
jgi:PhnB protein